MSGRRRAPGGLVPEDRALWDEVKKSVRPLRSPAPRLEPPPAKESAPTTAPRAPALRAAREPPPLAPLDRRTRARVARGTVGIDARLDLHGFTLERAHGRLARFLAASQAGGAGLALVITGKSGALRREVPHWLARPEFRTLVIGFEEAAPAHGGAGALYVRIRRIRQG